MDWKRSTSILLEAEAIKHFFGVLTTLCLNYSNAASILHQKYRIISWPFAMHFSQTTYQSLLSLWLKSYLYAHTQTPH
jgi:hypothetical protein